MIPEISCLPLCQFNLALIAQIVNPSVGVLKSAMPLRCCCESHCEIDQRLASIVFEVLPVIYAYNDHEIINICFMG